MKQYLSKIQRPTFIIVAAIISLVGVLFLAYFGYNYVSKSNLNTTVFLYGDSLGASSAALQLAKLNVPTIFATQGSTLGGQATKQGVSTFDQREKSYLYSSGYEQILDFLKTDSDSGYLGNAVTGPGGLPQKLDNLIKSSLKNSSVKLIYNTELQKVMQSAGKIKTIELKDDKKSYQIQADMFLDASDFADLSRMANVPFRIGLDTQEETGEKTALTLKERDIFINGVQTIDGKIGGFGNRIQPVTVPFSILDKGFYGNQIDFLKLSTGAQSIECNIINSRKCLEIKQDQSTNINFSTFSRSVLTISLVFEGDVADNQIEFGLNGDKIYAKKTLEKESGTYSVFQIQTKNIEQANLSVKNISGSSISLSEVLQNLNDQNQTVISKDITTLKKSAVKVWNKKDLVGNDKELKLDFDTQNLDKTQSYYLIADFANLQRDNSNRLQFVLRQSQNTLLSTGLDQTLDKFPGYYPLYKIDAGNTGFTLKITNNIDNTNLGLDGLILVPEGSVDAFKIIKNNEKYKLETNRLVDAYINDLQGRLPQVSKTQTGIFIQQQSKIDQNVENRPKFLFRNFMNQDDIINPNLANPNGQVLIRYLNEDHYAAYTYKNLSINSENTGKIISPGNYKIYFKLNYPKTQSPSGTVNFDFVSVENNNILSKKVDTSDNKYILLGTVRLNNNNNLKIKLSTDCGDCINTLKDNSKLMFVDDGLENYDPGEMDFTFDIRSNDGRLLRESPVQTSFFKYRQIVDQSNIFKNNDLDVSLKDQMSYRSLGITQVNTVYNDFEMEDVNLQKYAQDESYRNSLAQGAKNISIDYYYWLKYDIPNGLLGCGDGEIFCSGLRVQLTPVGMTSSDGFAEQPYVRDPVRPVGYQTLTSTNLSLVENNCTKQDQLKPGECVNLEFNNGRESQIYSVKTSFVNDFPSDTVGSFYYNMDMHKLVDSGLNNFYSYLKSQNYRQDSNLPLFLNGIFDNRVRPGSMRLSYLQSPSVNNLMFCGKNISASQIANGTTRLHPAEAMVGQVCGIAANWYTKNNEPDLAKLDEIQNRDLQFNLVKNGVYILPLEDAEIDSRLRSEHPDVLSAYYNILIKKLINPVLTQDSYKSTVIYSLIPSQPVTSDEFVKALDYLKIDYSVIPKSDFIDKKDLLGKISQSESDKFNDLIKSYSQKINIDNNQNTLTRGELAYIVYNW